MWHVWVLRESRKFTILVYITCMKQHYKNIFGWNNIWKLFSGQAFKIKLSFKVATDFYYSSGVIWHNWTSSSWFHSSGNSFLTATFPEIQIMMKFRRTTQGPNASLRFCVTSLLVFSCFLMTCQILFIFCRIFFMSDTFFFCPIQKKVLSLGDTNGRERILSFH